MTTISAKIIADSISLEGIRLTTMHLRYPRFIHAELMTHRVFSRNARSSRAVPVERMIQEVIDDPVIPIHWGKNQPGMQAYEECNNEVIIGWASDDFAWGTREQAWLVCRDAAVVQAKAFAQAGYHKQIVNRLLEPFMHIDVLVTATDWNNFFVLRDHEAAEPHIQVLAREMKKVMEDSTPAKLEPDQWHLPYINSEDWGYALTCNIFGYPSVSSFEEFLLHVSVARCARISYAPFDGDASYERELERYELLVGSTPLHASPTEHQATPDEFKLGSWEFPEQHGNLRGWRQYRKMLPNENMEINQDPRD